MPWRWPFMNLSKSQYCEAVQCPKMLWLKRFREDEFDSSCMNPSVLETGIEVGELARGLFGAYETVPYAKDYGKMLNHTKRLLEQGVPVIAEASFSYEGLFCRVDILKNLGNKEVEIYEVKSSTEVKDIYLEDAAYQLYILTMLGIQVKKVCLVYVNNRYVRHGEIDLSQLFTIKDITETALRHHDKVQNRIASLNEYMKQSEEPKDDIGEHCFTPYECGFFKYCTRHLPHPNIFDITNLTKKRKFEYYREGATSFEKLHDTDGLNRAHHLQIEHELYPVKPHIESYKIRKFLNTLSFPLYFLDFETFNPAIPMYDNSRPYEQITFQYSLHIMEREGGELKHKDYLGNPSQDPRRELAERLVQDIPLNVCTIAYNMKFEKARLKEMAALFPDLADHLMNIYDNIKDIMEPFQSKLYYVREMEGSYSIKKVLPALFPNEPSLNYENLEGVHNGEEALSAFKKMAEMKPDEAAVCRKNLLKYCELDTFAMVKIWERLCEVAVSKDND